MNTARIYAFGSVGKATAILFLYWRNLVDWVIQPQLTVARFSAVHKACHQVKLFRSPFRMIAIATIGIT